MLLLTAGESRLGLALAESLRKQGTPVVLAKPGGHFQEVSAEEFILDPADAKGYSELCERLIARNLAPRRVIHAWEAESLSPADKCENTTQGFFSLLHLVQTLGDQGRDEPVELTVVTANMHRIAGEGLLFPSRAAMLGVVQVAGRENPQLRCRSIDVNLDEATDLRKQSESKCDQQRIDRRFVEHLLAEVISNSKERIVALRNGRRWVRSFEPIRLGKPDSSKLRSGGVYLITGGLGGIGLALAEHLARAVQAHLVLLTRSGFPQREQWESFLQRPDSPVAETIRRLKACEDVGAEILVVQADVANQQQMQAALRQVQALYGALNGVIHAAGLPGGGLIELKTREAAESVLKPKVQGTLVLAKLLQDVELDFFAVCSSITTALEEIGQVDYCAANAFLDAFVEQHPAGVCINWDTWQEIGMAARTLVPAVLQHQHSERLRLGIRTLEGVEAFDRVLASGQRRVIVTPRDLSTRMQAEPPSTMPKARLGSAYPRPALAEAYVSPTNDLEQELAESWQTILGIEKVGIHDDFFQLGGHSLSAISLLSQIREQLGVHVKLANFFEASSVARLADLVLALQLASLDPAEAARILDDASALP